MDYKEEYQNALERAKKGLPIDEVFPELKESEDERIRKEMIHWLKGFIGEEEGCGYTEDEIRERIAYLEKQKEQKPVPKFSVGDYVKDTNYKGEPLYQIVGIDKECYICEYRGDKNMGDRAVMHFTFDNPNLRLEQRPAEWSEHQHKLLNYAISMTDDAEVKNFLKSLRPQLHKWYIKKGHWYVCIVDKPEYGWIKGKVYQSPEDNRIETDYKGDLTNWPDYEPWFRPATRDEIPDSKPHWKPSEEQMEALARATNRCVGVDDAKILVKLLEQLEKL